MLLENKVAVITGASRGIGREIAARFAAVVVDEDHAGRELRTAAGDVALGELADLDALDKEKTWL